MPNRNKPRIRGLLPPAKQGTLVKSCLTKFDFVQRLKTAEAKQVFPFFQDTTEEMLMDFAGDMKHQQFFAKQPDKAEEAFKHTLHNLGVVNLLLVKNGREPITEAELRALFFKGLNKPAKA